MPTSTAERLVQAAADGVAAIDTCFPAMMQMEIPNNERNNVALSLLYASLEQGRSASFLVEHDVEESTFSALILLRSQIDQLMRGAFFTAPATSEELEYFLKNDKLPKRDGNKLGPKSLSKINDDFFGWKKKVHNLVNSSWDPLSGAVHGGRAALKYYVGEEGIGAHPPTDEFVPMLSNAVVFTHVAVATALHMAVNKQADKLQLALHKQDQVFRKYSAKWAPNAASAWAT